MKNKLGLREAFKLKTGKLLAGPKVEMDPPLAWDLKDAKSPSNLVLLVLLTPPKINLKPN